MYPALRETEPGHSGTGVYYQAIPAVGADGKNIMKLIPVQMVNGQFFRTDVNKPRTDSTPQKAVTTNIASAPIQVAKKPTSNDIPAQQIVKKQVSSLNTTSNQVEMDHGYSLNKCSLQQQAVDLTDKVPTIATPATNCGRSVRRPCQVTVKSPPLTRGHHPQIASNAQVQTVPASELSQGVKTPTFNLSGNSSPGSNSPSVAYLSPATTVNQGVTPPTDCARDSLKLLSDTSNKAQCGSQSKGSKPHLKLIPKASQRPNSPIKWVIEEEDNSTILRAVAGRETLGKDCEIIKTTPFASSKVLQAVAEKETSRKGCDSTEKTVSQSDLSKSGQGQENALVMCNGRAFYLSKKCSVPLKMGQKDPPTSVTKSFKSNRATVPSSQQSNEPVGAQAQQDLRIIIPDESDDVIDLCDEEDSTPPAAAVDEDNVIFVSYIPPKSESGSAKDMMLKTQTALEKETDKTSASSSNSVTDKSSRTGGDDEDRDRGPAPREKQPGQSVLFSTDKNVPHVCGSAVTNNKSQQSTSTQQVESMEVDVETQSPADTSTLDSSSGTSQKGKDTDKMHSCPNPAPCWTFSLPPKHCQMTDHVLRQMFGVTADVKICLQRIDETSLLRVLAQPLQIESVGSVGHQQEVTNTIQDLYESCKKQKTINSSGLINVRRVQLLNELEFSADPATLTSHTYISMKNKCHSVQNSLYGTSCDVESAPVIGYVEPIDEDFPSTDENEVLRSYDTTAQSQPQTVDLNAKTRRIGRTRKRTMCPCCTPGTLSPAVKSTVRLEEPERWAWTAEQISKNEGRTKAPGQDGTTSGKISCLKAKNKQKYKAEVAASNSLTTTSMDTDELKQHEDLKKNL